MQEVPLKDFYKYENAEWEISRTNRLIAMKQDKKQIREFRERLLLNMNKV